MKMDWIVASLLVAVPGLLLSACGTPGVSGSPAVVAGEPTETHVTNVERQDPNGVPYYQSLGPKRYSSTAMWVLASGYNLTSISINDAGGLTSFTVPSAPEGFETGEYRFSQIQLDSKGAFIAGDPASATAGCTVVVNVDTSTHPPTTTYSCQNDDCAPPKYCQLYRLLYQGTYYYGCDCVSASE